MKKIVFFLLLLVLTSCGGTSSITSSGLTDYSTDTFSMQIPSNWVVLNSDSKTLPEPKQGRIVLAVSSAEAKDGFSNNLVVLQNQLNYNTDSKTFSELNNRGASSEYFSYKAISQSDATFSDGDTSTIYTFQAQYNAGTPKLTFLQTGRVCKGNNSFFLTIALPMNITDSAKYEDILKTFACK